MSISDPLSIAKMSVSLYNRKLQYLKNWDCLYAYFYECKLYLIVNESLTAATRKCELAYTNQPRRR